MSKQQASILEMRSKKSESFVALKVKLDSGHICNAGCRMQGEEFSGCPSLVGGTVSQFLRLSIRGWVAHFSVLSSQVVHPSQLVGGTVSGWGAPVARQGGAGVGGRRMGVGAKPASSRQLQRGAPAPAGQQRHAASWKEQATQPHNLNHLTALVRKMYRKALRKGLERTLSVTAML